MRIQKILGSLLIPLIALLLFLLLFENRVVVPQWLQVAGRMHPLFLHFPIVLLILYFAVVLIGRKARQTFPEEFLLMFVALTSVITALMGMLLSREEGYDVEALQWHKWGGISLAVLSSCLYWFRNLIINKRAVAIIASALLFPLLLFTGHQGAGITHGQNFLVAPILPEKKELNVSIEEAEVYAHMVQPILEGKCMGCHNSRKAKGELIMETKELLLKGGKHGVLWDSTTEDLGLLLRRLHLPLEQKKHMPPQGKPQLTDEELLVIYYWIKEGASFTAKVSDLPQSDTLYQLASTIFTRKEADEYDFDEADEKTVSKLNNNNRAVYQLALNSPGLAVNFYNKEFYSTEKLNELEPVREQIVSLDLSSMPIKDDDLNRIAEFRNLRKLNLNFTQVTGTGFNHLSKLKFLKQLSLAGTQLKKENLSLLEKLPQLKTVYIWNAAIPVAELEELKKVKGHLKYETGYRDTVIMKLTPPILENEEQVITDPLPLQLKHYIKGTVIRYTTDGTDPDSSKSPVYNKEVVLNSNSLVKAKAFKPGWESSDIMQQYFFKSGYKADSAILLQPSDPKYSGEGAKTLINLKKSDLGAGSGKWLGFRNNRMETLLLFNEPKNISGVNLSTLKNIGGYIMPPVSVEVWGGNSRQSLKLLGRINPAQPDSIQPVENIPLEIKFKPASLKVLKVVAVPVPKLPKWHPGKGDKGWVFVDEIFVY